MSAREKYNAIMLDVQAAIDAVCEKHGLERTQVPMRYARDGSMFRISTTDLRAKSTGSVVADVPKMKLPQGEIDAALARALAKLGVTKVTNRDGEQVVAYKPNRPKYPFVFRGPRGGLWKASAAEIKRKFA